MNKRSYTVCDSRNRMTFLEALDILEAATLECNARDIDLPEVTAALDLLEAIRPARLGDPSVPLSSAAGIR
jgi:hypothetical protein